MPEKSRISLAFMVLYHTLASSDIIDQKNILPTKRTRTTKSKKIIEIKLDKTEKKSKPTISWKFKKKSEMEKHIDNLRIVLESSNATPIKSRGGVGYTCCFCKEAYHEPSDLKQHTLKLHKDDKSSFMKGEQLMSYIVKLDITQLHCKLCQDSIEDLENFLEHLRLSHNKPIHTDIKNHIVPFKFDCEILKCVLCKSPFNNFKILLIHMNVHYKNYVCEICGNGFINRKILSAHGYRHVKGVFKCEYCEKIFDTRVKQKDHERAVHKHLNKRSKCSYCGEKFSDYTKKNNHEVKVHGVKPVTLKCQACNKTFDNQRSLTVHTKRYHLMERWRTKRQNKS